MNAEFDQTTADRLMEQAFQALDLERPKDALKIGRSLERMRYSGCFEVQALAYAALGKRAKAIKVLETGTEKCPNVWQLWQLLGNYLSDEGRMEAACEAYEKGLATDQPYRESLSLNLAIALIRWDRPTEARARLAPIIDSSDFQSLDGSLRARMLAAELEACRLLEDCEAAVRRFEDLGQHDFDDGAAEEQSILWAEYALALMRLDRRDAAKQAAIQAARSNPQNDHALWILRETRKKAVAGPITQYRLMLAGEWRPQSTHAGEKFDGFFANYDVCADSEAEALGFVLELQPDGVENLRIEEVSRIGTTSDPKGVYSAGGYINYRDDDA
jgi:tetratricopeptide (TPR) repeat protein